MAKKQKQQAGPDAWMALVLGSMGTEELRKEIENPANSAEQVAQLQAELQKRLKR